MKRILAALCAFLLCAFLFSCGDNGSEQTPQSGSPTLEPEINTSFFFDDLTIETDRSAAIRFVRGDEKVSYRFVSRNTEVASVSNEKRTVHGIAPGQTEIEVYLSSSGRLVALFSVTVTAPVVMTEPPTQHSTTELPTIGSPTSEQPTTETPISGTPSVEPLTSETPTDKTPSSEMPTTDTPTIEPSTPETPTTTETVPYRSFEVIGPTDVFAGNPYYLIIRSEPENANEDLVYSCSQPEICEIEENGVFHPRANGTVRLTVSTADGRITDYVTVYIHNYVTDIAVTGPAEINVGETCRVSCKILPEGTSHSGVYWVNEKGSKNQYEGVLSISYDGLICEVTALRAGVGCITIGSNDFPDSIIKTIFIIVH